LGRPVLPIVHGKRNLIDWQVISVLNITMPLRRALSLSLFIALYFSPAPTEAQVKFPQSKGYVNDFANVIDVDTKKRLDALCQELDEKAHAQIAVVTIDSLEDTPVGDYARLLFNNWGIGHKDDNRGMLVLLAITDHTYYISVGRGFEALFPNNRVAVIGSEMVPSLSHHHYSKAALQSAGKIANIIAHERRVTLTTLEAEPSIR
jgi:uncharacterized protein